MTLSTELFAIGERYVVAQLNHPTLCGVASGTISDRAFAHWLEQDYLYLQDYVRVFGLLAGSAPLAHLGELVDLAHATWHDEMSLHRELAASFGADLDHAEKSSMCEEYTQFLLAATKDYADGLAALLPCMWGYAELGRRMPVPSEPRFARWVQTYKDPGFQASAYRCAQILDEAWPAERPHARAAELFERGMRLELRFWDVPAGPLGQAPTS